METKDNKFNGLEIEIYMLDQVGEINYKNFKKVMAGIKDEKGKPRVSLIDMSYVMGIIETFEHGAKTYELNNWLQLKPETLYNAMFRHIAAMAMGEYYDSKSGLPHLFHVGANAMMIYSLTKKEGKFESNFDLFNNEA